MSPCRILHHAVNRERNVFRAWHCVVDRDLFGVLVVSVTYGRIGTTGRTIHHAMTDESAVGRFVQHALRRRASAERRCGAVYRVIESTGIDHLMQ